MPSHLRLRLHLRLQLALLVGGCTLAGACNGDDSDDDAGTPSCVEIDYQGCAMLYPPTWDEVWQQTMQPSCSVGGGVCHPAGGPAGSLTFFDQATTYTELIDGGHLIPGDPRCSDLMIRLESDDPNFRMPPGQAPIPERARCSIAAWIEQGAPEN